MVGNVIKLKPITARPVNAVILNTGEKVSCEIVSLPTDPYAFLRLVNLPVSELSDEVIVIKLEFDKPLNKLAGPPAKTIAGARDASAW